MRRYEITDENRERKDVWKHIFGALQDPELQWLMLDSTVVRVYQHAGGQKSTNDEQALGRARELLQQTP